MDTDTQISSRIFNVLSQQPSWLYAQEIATKLQTSATPETAPVSPLRGALNNLFRLIAGKPSEISDLELYRNLNKLKKAGRIRADAVTPQTYIGLLHERYGQGPEFLQQKERLDKIWQRQGELSPGSKPLSQVAYRVSR